MVDPFHEINRDADCEEMAVSSYVLKSIQSETSFILKHGLNLVGRNRSKCRLVLEHSSVSRIHCAFYWSHQHFFICDLGSRNGVYVNQKRIRLKKLEPGDKIHIGRIEFQFVKSMNAESHPELDNSESLTTIDPDTDTELNMDQTKQFEPDDLNIKMETLPDLLDDDIESDQLDSRPKQKTGFLKRHKTTLPEENESRIKINISPLKFQNLRKSILLKRVILLVASVVVLWGISRFLDTGPSSTEIYQTLSLKLEEIQSYREKGAKSSEWVALANQYDTEFQPIIHSLEKKANVKNRIEQELLRAARDCLPKMYLKSRQDVCWHELRFEEHLENVRMLLDNKMMEEKNIDSQYPTKPGRY